VQDIIDSQERFISKRAYLPWGGGLVEHTKSLNFFLILPVSGNQILKQSIYIAIGQVSAVDEYKDPEESDVAARRFG
jgi:hypothetical protein